MPWIDHAHTQRFQRIPALANCVPGLLIDRAWWREIARKGHSLIQHQRYAITRVTRCPDDFTHNPEVREECPALASRQLQIVVQRDIHIRVDRLHIALEDGNGGKLLLRTIRRTPFAFTS
jgi:hypothetical protein